ncbi:MAG: hypothetical protein U0236_14015 [Nitrospira sp.]
MLALYRIHHILPIAILACSAATTAYAQQWNGAPGTDGPIARPGPVAIGPDQADRNQAALLDLKRPMSGSTDDLLFTARSTFRDMTSTVFQIDTKRVYVGGAAGKSSIIPDGVYDLAVGRGVAIGLNNLTDRLPTDYKLAVGGKILAEEVRVKLIKDWADYVFTPTHRLASLPEVEQFIQTHHHLPEIPTAAEVGAQGVDIGQMQAKLLAKIEELTLHLIEQHKTITTLQGRISELESARPGAEARTNP